jgi:D-threo-aldose 1-dehydrogenase
MVTSVDRTWMRPLGATGLTVSAVCAGGAPLGSMPANFGYEVTAHDAVELVQEILRSPIRFIDTANGYSAGESERRIGEAIAAFGGPPADLVVATKVDPCDGDYSGARVRRSVAESRLRLGLSTLPLVHLHDPEFHPWDAMTAKGGAVDTLAALKESGEVGNIGLAGGSVPVMARYLDLGVFDVLLVHNRWTLVDRGAEALIERALDQGMAVINAAIYGGGILARMTDAGGASYGYRPAHPDTLRAICEMRQVCRRYGTDLATAALQFSLRDQRIASTVVGFSKKERLTQIMASTESALPEPFWQEMADLLPPAHAWLDSGTSR